LHSNDFTDTQIEKSIAIINNDERSNFLYELLDEIMRDTSEVVNIHFIYKKMLSAFYSSEEIAFYMDSMKDD